MTKPSTLVIEGELHYDASCGAAELHVHDPDDVIWVEGLVLLAEERGLKLADGQRVRITVELLGAEPAYCVT